MKILIIGSTGGTGRRLVLQGCDAGHTVTAMARNPEEMVIRHQNLSVIQGDVLKPETLDEAIKGQDAVLSALGTKNLSKSSIISDGTKNVITAMEKHGVKRFVCETSLGVGDSRGQLGWLYEYVIVPLILKNAMDDKEVQEHHIRQSNLDWVIVRPAGLTDDRHSGNYYVWTGKPGRSIKGTISRADVADFMLRNVTDDTYLRQAVGIAYV